MSFADKNILNNSTNKSDFESNQTLTIFFGLLISYTGLITMALLPIFIGSLQSVPLQVENKIKKNMIWTITKKHIIMLPLVFIGFLFTLYFNSQEFSVEHCINLSAILQPNIFGVVTLSNFLRNQFSARLPNIIPKTKYQLQFSKDNGVKKLDWINVEFTMHDVIIFNLCTALGIFNLYSKHWISNNILALAIAIHGVTFIHINKIKTGFVVLCSLFVCNIFCIYCTDVKGTVYKSFDAPNQIIFPYLLKNDILASTNFCVLGLGDIVFPGIFIAFLLRFDHSLKLKTNFYFNATFLAYFLGLLTKIFVELILEVTQPAILYLIPACLITPITIALIFGDLKTLFSYEDLKMKSKKPSKKSK